MPQADKAVLFSIAFSSLTFYVAVYLVLTATLFLTLCNTFKLVSKQSAQKFWTELQRKGKAGASSRFFWVAL